MITGRERLAQWRVRSRMKQRDLARLLEMTEAYMSQILSGGRTPGLDTAVRIERLTGVPVESWVDSSFDVSGKEARRLKKKANRNSELSAVVGS